MRLTSCQTGLREEVASVLSMFGTSSLAHARPRVCGDLALVQGIALPSMAQSSMTLSSVSLAAPAATGADAGRSAWDPPIW